MNDVADRAPSFIFHLLEWAGRIHFIVYGGDYYSYSITPIASDVTPGSQSVRVVWSVEQ